MTTLSDMRDEVRELCADPDTTEISDAKIESILTKRVLKWINRRKPGKAITNLTTVKDQQDYDVKPSNAYRITEVWWMEADFEFFSPSLRYVPNDHDVNFQMAGFSVIDNPSLVTLFYKQVAQYRHSFKGTGEETESGLLRLEPFPAGSGDLVYFEYSYPRFAAIPNITDEFTEGCTYKGAQLVLQKLAIKRGRVTGGRNFRGGGGKNELEMAKEYGDEADSEVPGVLSVFSVG